MNKEIISTQKNVLMCATYILPIESTYFNDDSFHPRGGDQSFPGKGTCTSLVPYMPELNKNLTPSAHMGTNTWLQVTAFPPPYAPVPHNYANITNKNSPQLLQLCYPLGMYIVNGRL